MSIRKAHLAAVGVVVAALVAPGAALARTVSVYASGPVSYQNSLMRTTGAMVHDFLPETVTINQGDTVVWNGPALAAGGHTLDLPGRSGHDLPLAVPDPTHPVTDALDAAGKPFWFNGRPSLALNPMLLAPTADPGGGAYTYDGSARIDSGIERPPGHSIAVTFTKPGVYHYFCDVHNGMGGTVVVLPKDRTVPSTAQDAAMLKSQEARDQVIARRLDRTKITGDNVSLGEAGADGVEVMAMFPATLHVKVGTVVTFSISKLSRDAHTATFGDTSAHGFVTKLAQTALTGPMIDPRAGYPSAPPGGPIQLSPTTNGDGFANTGLLDRDPGTPNPPSAQIQFTKPGVYHYICLIHPMMRGTIIVR